MLLRATPVPPLMHARWTSASGRFREPMRPIRTAPGFERLAAALRQRLPERPVYVAFNEFCAPTIEQAVATAVMAGARDIAVVTTMITPGGSHAERDIPEALERARAEHPDANIHFVWPLDLHSVADMFCVALSS